jgi:hypothetical protein
MAQMPVRARPLAYWQVLGSAFKPFFYSYLQLSLNPRYLNCRQRRLRETGSWYGSRNGHSGQAVLPNAI